MLRPMLLLSMLALPIIACQQQRAIPEEPPVHGFATDPDAFQRYIAGHPTPAQFRAHYPDIKLVLPGEISTRELRLNRSRYFAELDADGRITGGRFQ